MRNLFIAFAYSDESFARGLSADLARTGLTLGYPVALWPGMRLTPRIEAGLRACHSGLVVVSGEFLALGWPGYELDRIAAMDRVVPLLHGINEEDVSVTSPRLAIASIATEFPDRLARLFKSVDCEGCNGHHLPD